MTIFELQTRKQQILHEEHMAMLAYGAASFQAAVTIVSGASWVVGGATAAALSSALATFITTYGNLELELDNVNAQITALAKASSTPLQVNIVNAPVITLPNMTITSTAPLQKPVQLSNDDDLDGVYENGVSFTIKGNSIMVVDKPTATNGSTGGIKVNNTQCYGPVAPGVDATKPPVKALNLTKALGITPTTGTSSGGTTSGSGSGVHGSGSSNGNPGNECPPPSECPPPPPSECPPPPPSDGGGDCGDCGDC